MLRRRGEEEVQIGQPGGRLAASPLLPRHAGRKRAWAGLGGNDAPLLLLLRRHQHHVAATMRPRPARTRAHRQALRRRSQEGERRHGGGGDI